MAKTPVAKIERYAMVQDGVTINLIIWDGVTELTLPEGVTLKKEKDAPKYEPQTLD